MRVRGPWTWILSFSTYYQDVVAMRMCFVDLSLQGVSLTKGPSYCAQKSILHLHQGQPFQGLLPVSNCMCRRYKAGMGGMKLSWWPVLALEFLNGLAEPSLDCMKFQGTATHPSFPFSFTHCQICIVSVSSPRLLPCVPYTGIFPNKIIAYLILSSWCLFLRLSGLTHEVNLDKLFHLWICFLIFKTGLIIPSACKL